MLQQLSYAQACVEKKPCTQVLIWMLTKQYRSGCSDCRMGGSGKGPMDASIAHGFCRLISCQNFATSAMSKTSFCRLISFKLVNHDHHWLVLKLLELKNLQIIWSHYLDTSPGIQLTNPSQIFIITCWYKHNRGCTLCSLVKTKECLFLLVIHITVTVAQSKVYIAAWENGRQNEVSERYKP
jgi:hypothetical protein